MSQQPIPGTHPLSRVWSGPLQSSLFGLAPDGVFRAASLALRAVRSYRTFSPLPAFLANRRRFILCGTFRRDGSRRHRPRVSRPHKPGLRGIAPCGVRTFLPRLAPGAILHPSKTSTSLTESQIQNKAQPPSASILPNPQAMRRVFRFENDWRQKPPSRPLRKKS